MTADTGSLRRGGLRESLFGRYSGLRRLAAAIALARVPLFVLALVPALAVSGAAAAQTITPYYADTSSYDHPAFRFIDVYPQPNPRCLWHPETTVDLTARPIRVVLVLRPHGSCDVPGGSNELITDRTIWLPARLPAGRYTIEFGYQIDGDFIFRKSVTLDVDAGVGKCGRLPEINVLIVEPSSSAALERIVAVVGNPASDPEFHERLGRPVGVRRYLTFGWLDLQYAPLDDHHDILRRIQAQLAELGLVNASPNTFVCVIPYYEPIEIVEFYNVHLGHYFMTENAEEIASIENGGSGTGWQRTGESMVGVKGDGCHPWAPDATPLFRFHGTRGIGPNSHFFTADRQECGAVRRDPGWTFENVPFRVYAPIAGVCPASSTPIHRLYNGRAAQNDSNHRYTVRQSIVESMVAAGWRYEGVTLCLPLPSSPAWQPG